MVSSTIISTFYLFIIYNNFNIYIYSSDNFCLHSSGFFSKLFFLNYVWLRLTVSEHAQQAPTSGAVQFERFSLCHGPLHDEICWTFAWMGPVDTAQLPVESVMCFEKSATHCQEGTLRGRRIWGHYSAYSEPRGCAKGLRFTCLESQIEPPGWGCKSHVNAAGGLGPLCRVCGHLFWIAMSGLLSNDFLELIYSHNLDSLDNTFHHHTNLAKFRYLRKFRGRPSDRFRAAVRVPRATDSARPSRERLRAAVPRVTPCGRIRWSRLNLVFFRFKNLNIIYSICFVRFKNLNIIYSNIFG